MKNLALRLLGLAVIIMTTLPFIVNQLHGRDVENMLAAYWNGGPYTATVVVGPFCFFAVICMLLVFVSFIFDSDRMGAVALMSLLVSGVLGFIVFDIAVIAKTTTAPRLDLTSLFSSQTSPFFLWGSILGAIIGALAGFCMKVPSRSKKISNPEKNPDT